MPNNRRNINIRSSLNVGSNPLPVREDFAAALHKALYKGDRFAMQKYYSHVESIVRVNPNYIPISKDDLGIALKMDVKNRGHHALDDYYRHERKLASLGININGSSIFNKKASSNRSFNNRRSRKKRIKYKSKYKNK